MREYYVLLENQIIICIFEALMDIISWTPPRPLLDQLVIHRIKEEAGIFTVQNIQISAAIYNLRIGVL